MFWNRRVIACFSFKCGFMNCMNSTTLWNLLSPCLISKYGQLDVVTFTLSVPAGSFNPFCPGRSKGDAAGKVWTCRNTANPIRQCPALWNIFKLNMPSLFHYFSKWNFKSKNSNILDFSNKSFPPRLTFFPLTPHLPGWKIATRIIYGNVALTFLYHHTQEAITIAYLGYLGKNLGDSIWDLVIKLIKFHYLLFKLANVTEDTKYGLCINSPSKINHFLFRNI